MGVRVRGGPITRAPLIAKALPLEKAARTCQIQQLNTLMYLTAAIQSYRRRQVVASLLSKRSTP